MTCYLVPTGSSNEPDPIQPHEAQQQFILLCGNDNFSTWFYQDIMIRCRI